MARVRVALVFVDFAVSTSKSFCALAGVGVGAVYALSPVLARRAGTLVDVVLTQVPVKACGALAVELVDLIDAVPVVQAGAAGTLVRVDFTVNALVTWHADTLEFTNLIQAGGVVLARIREAFIDVYLTAGTRIPLETLALEGPLGVDAFPSMLTRIGS